MIERIKLVPGTEYTVHGSKSVVVCQWSEGSDAGVVNKVSGWSCTVHDPARCDDGTIIWEYSTSGRFQEVKK